MSGDGATCLSEVSGAQPNLRVSAKDMTDYELDLKPYELRSVALSPDGRLVAVARKLSLVVSDVRTRTPILEVPHGFWRVAFDTQSALLVGTGDDLAVQVWDIRKRRQLARRPLSSEFEAEWSTVAFTHDGRRILTYDNNVDATLWIWRDEDLLRELCKSVTQNLTPDQWREYVGDDQPYRKTCIDVN
jgi:WD40 repeat protein